MISAGRKEVQSDVYHFIQTVAESLKKKKSRLETPSWTPGPSQIPGMALVLFTRNVQG